MPPKPPKRDVVVIRLVDAPLEQVWHAWTDSEAVKPSVLTKTHI